MKFLYDMMMVQACILVLLLPGCGVWKAAQSLATGQDADLNAVIADLDATKAGLKAADANNDGKLGLMEAAYWLLGIGGGGIYATSRMKSGNRKKAAEDRITKLENGAA